MESIVEIEADIQSVRALWLEEQTVGEVSVVDDVKTLAAVRQLIMSAALAVARILACKIENGALWY